MRHRADAYCPACGGTCRDPETIAALDFKPMSLRPSFTGSGQSDVQASPQGPEVRLSHPCPIKDCSTPAKDGQLMCWAHWRRVPKALNRAVFETYRNLRHDPEPYRQARDEAIRIVNEKEAEG